MEVRTGWSIGRVLGFLGTFLFCTPAYVSKFIIFEANQRLSKQSIRLQGSTLRSCIPGVLLQKWSVTTKLSGTTPTGSRLTWNAPNANPRLMLPSSCSGPLVTPGYSFCVCQAGLLQAAPGLFRSRGHMEIPLVALLALSAGYMKS